MFLLQPSKLVINFILTEMDDLDSLLGELVEAKEVPEQSNSRASYAAAPPRASTSQYLPQEPQHVDYMASSYHEPQQSYQPAHQAAYSNNDSRASSAAVKVADDGMQEFYKHPHIL